MKYIANYVILTAAISVFFSFSYAQTAKDVKIEGAWVRQAVAGQSGTGGFMKLTAPSAMKLIGISSPVAGIGEVHEMRMEGSVMRMAELKNGLELPAGKSVELKPGGYHVMLLDLKQSLKPGSEVPLTLTFTNAKGEKSSVEVKAPVAVRAPGSEPGKDMSGHGGQGHKH